MFRYVKRFSRKNQIYTRTEKESIISKWCVSKTMIVPMVDAIFLSLSRTLITRLWKGNTTYGINKVENKTNTENCKSFKWIALLVFVKSFSLFSLLSYCFLLHLLRLPNKDGMAVQRRYRLVTKLPPSNGWCFRHFQIQHQIQCGQNGGMCG